MGSRSILHPRVVRAQLNHHLADVMVEIQEEIHDTFAATFPPCVDWTEVNVVDCMTQTVARVSSRMCGGAAPVERTSGCEPRLPLPSTAL